MMILLSINNLVSTMTLLPHGQGTHRRNKFVKEVLCSIDYTFYFNWSLFGDHLQKKSVWTSLSSSALWKIYVKKLHMRTYRKLFLKKFFQSALSFHSVIPTYSQAQRCVCPGGLARIVCVFCGWKRILFFDSSLYLLASSLLLITNGVLDCSSIPFRNQSLA